MVASMARIDEIVFHGVRSAQAAHVFTAGIKCRYCMSLMAATACGSVPTTGGLGGWICPSIIGSRHIGASCLLQRVFRCESDSD